MGSSSSKPAAVRDAASAAEAQARTKTLGLITRYITSFSSGRALVKGPQDVDLRDELETMKKNMEGQVLALTEERDKAQEKIRQQNDTLAAVQLDRDELSTKVAGMEERAKLLKFRMEQLGQQLNSELEQTRTLKAQLTRRETDMQIVENELAQVRTQHAQTVTLLDARTTELKGAQAFLTKADTTSGADVVRMIEGLNGEILQMSAFVADHFEFKHPKLYTANEEVQAASTRLAELIGPKMVELLATMEHAQDPLVIQLACQAATAAYCRYIVMSWDIDDETFNGFLQATYFAIHGSGKHSFALTILADV